MKYDGAELHLKYKHSYKYVFYAKNNIDKTTITINYNSSNISIII